MGIFDRFKKKKPEQLSTEALNWNRLFELWSEGKLASPYNELVGYYSEISGDGHGFYFMNMEGNEDSENTVNILTANLPEILKNNLEKAYELYRHMENETDEAKAEQLSKELYQCDVFYAENEKLLEATLQEYANSL